MEAVDRHRMEDADMSGATLLAATILLVLAGCLLYVADLVGWAQLLWVLASGSAGAAAVQLVDRR